MTIKLLIPENANRQEILQTCGEALEKDRDLIRQNSDAMKLIESKLEGIREEGNPLTFEQVAEIREFTQQTLYNNTLHELTNRAIHAQMQDFIQALGTHQERHENARQIKEQAAKNADKVYEQLYILWIFFTEAEEGIREGIISQQTIADMIFKAQNELWEGTTSLLRGIS